MNIFKQIGQFQVTREVFENADNIDLLLNVFSQFIILRCEYDSLSNLFTYTAFNKEFDIVESGDTIPMYDISVDSITEEFEIIKRVIDK